MMFKFFYLTMMASSSIRECSLHKVSGSHIIVSFAQKK